uniref:DIS3-like exonuclease 2 n=1 Tax=Strigamia maritima TaxID=126957 RepID=T1IJ75_STRMM
MSSPARFEEGVEISGDNTANSSPTSLYTWGDQKPNTSMSKSVQKSRTRQPPNTLMVPNLIKVDRSSNSLETPSAEGSKIRDKNPPPTGTKSKNQKNHRRNKTSDSDSSKASSLDGSRKEKDFSFEDRTPSSLTGAKLPIKNSQSRPRKERSLDSSRRTTPKTPRKSPKPFEPFISLEEVQRGLKKGELIEGILRINPKNYEDAYISAPDGQMDIYIGGVLDRNRALHGDVVVVQIKPQMEWKVLSDGSKPGDLKSIPVTNNSAFQVCDTIEILSTGTKKTRRGKRGKKKRKNRPLETCTNEKAMSPILELDKSCEGLIVEPDELVQGILDGNLESKLDCVDEELEGNGGVVVAPHELSEVDDSGKEDASACSNDLMVEITELMNNNSLDQEPDGWGPPVPEPINSWCETNLQVNNSVGNSNISTENTLPSLAELQLPSSKSKMAFVEAVLKHPLAHKLLQKTAKVVYLKERKHNLVAVGHLKLMQDRNPNWALFSPQDHRLPRITIPMKECPPNFFSSAEDHAKILYIAKITEWENTGFAKGHLYRSIGEAGLIATETEAILISNNVDYSDFADNLLEALPDKLPWTIPEEELKVRRDLRKECIFTIDPETAKDLDDAVSCRELSDGTWEVGVHIADVSYFIPEGSKIDSVAAHRATSVYMVQMVVPMLPQLLCEHLCSLNPGEERLTMSVMWKITPVGDILEEWFGRSVINSCAKLSYEQAQKLIDNPDNEWKSGEMPQVQGEFNIATIASKVGQLNQLALILRKQRFDGGALCLNQVKLHFSLDSDSGLPSTFSVYEQKDSNRLIEEFMLLANMAVAHKILKSFPGKAVLRCHPPPIQHLMDEVLETFSTVGLNLDSSSAGKIQESLTHFRKDSSLISQARQLAITSLLSKPMQRALYFCAGSYECEKLYHHYALNVPLYTHFTSPIRRYADILVHRLLAAALDYTQEPLVDKRWLQRQCEHCNDKKYAAKLCQESSQEIYLGAFIKETNIREEVAMVIAVLDHSFDVLILQFGIVKRVYCDKLPLLGKHYQKQHGIPHLTLTWRADDNHPTCAQTVTIFSMVTVMLTPSNEPLKFQALLQRPFDTPGNFPPNFTVPKI